MKALYMEKRGSMELCERPVPEVKDGWALVKMRKCGFCGTDVHGFMGLADNYRYPVIIGHEAVGTIVEIDENNERGLKPGDRVTCEPYTSCGVCYSCKRGRYNNCEHLSCTGVHQDGMLAEYHSHPIHLIHKLPDNISDNAACIIEPLAIGLNGTKRLDVQPGEICAVAGSGAIGILSALACKARGGIPIICDIHDERLEYAKAMGIEYTCNNAKQDFAEYIRSVNNGHLADCFYEACGDIEVCRHMCDYVENTGRIVLLGWTHKEFVFDKDAIIRKEVDVFGSRNASHCFPGAINLIAGGFVDAEKLISHVISIEEAIPTLRKMEEHPERFQKVIVDLEA